MEVVTSATDALSLHDALPISADVILFVSGGPNTRNDFHVNPTEELFYQLKGDIAVRVRPLDGSRPKDVVVREGELRSEERRVGKEDRWRLGAWSGADREGGEG